MDSVAATTSGQVGVVFGILVERAARATRSEIERHMYTLSSASDTSEPAFPPSAHDAVNVPCWLCRGYINT
jgi:hypothetical protein